MRAKKITAEKVAARPITITITGEFAKRVRAIGEITGTSKVETARALARLGMMICEPTPEGEKLRKSFVMEGWKADDFYYLPVEIVSNFYALEGRNGCP